MTFVGRLATYKYLDMDEVGAQQFDACGDVRHDMLKIEAGVGAWHDDLAELDIAGRAPREHA